PARSLRVVEGPALELGASSFASVPLAAPPATAPLFRGRNLALSLWALGAALLGLGAARSYLRLRIRLHRRPRIVGGDLHAQLTQLAAGADLGGVRLTCSSRVPVPLALG